MRIIRGGFLSERERSVHLIPAEYALCHEKIQHRTNGQIQAPQVEGYRCSFAMLLLKSQNEHAAGLFECAAVFTRVGPASDPTKAGPAADRGDDSAGPRSWLCGCKGVDDEGDV
jgi:hypothetical protein